MWETFEYTLRQLLPKENQQLRLTHIGDVADNFKAGVDFENIEDLVQATHLAYECLLKEMRNKNILVDITGGQKTTTIAGAVVALDAGREFQYVSMHDYKTRTYDVSYLG